MGTVYRGFEAIAKHPVQGVAMVHAEESSIIEALSTRLKAEGRVKFSGVSYHGPSRTGQGNMAEVLSAAAEDGRFDMMLLVYNFMNSEQGDQVLSACKANNVGATIMKSAPGVLHWDSFDPDQMTDEQKNFADRFGLRTDDQLRYGSIQWVLQNPDAHTVCISLNDFDNIDRVVSISGSKLSQADEEMLDRLAMSVNSRYCRHGCVECAGACPLEVPVSRIMRYGYYFGVQGREKHAMSRYAKLGGSNGSVCLDCTAPCDGACPHGFPIRAQMSKVHSMLTLA
jgi:predicted aldo/keto reductase-like oxidoreductase